MQNEENARVYRILPNFNSKCNKCNLRNNHAIGGHSFSRIQDTELLIVAAYPATEEVKKGYSLAPNQTRPNIDKPNAGRYVKYSCIFHFDKDDNFPNELKPFYNKVAFTNIIKCSPFSHTGNKLDIKPNHIKICKTMWLEKEIEAISKFNPTCPILLCGSEAAKLLNPKQTVYSSRRKIHLYKNTHPIIITFNPVEVVRYTSYCIDKQRVNTKGKLIVQSRKPEKPVIIGSTIWHWKKDMELIKQLVLNNYYSKNKKVSEFNKLIERFDYCN